MPNTSPSPEVVAERERAGEIAALVQVCGATAAMLHDSIVAIRRGDSVDEFKRRLIDHHRVECLPKGGGQ